jgi:hypothetical protein
MVSKILKVVLDAAVSFVFFFIAAIILDWAASKAFGTHTGVNGDQVVNVNGGVMMGVTLIVTLAFAVWFYRFLTTRKVTKIKG